MLLQRGLRLLHAGYNASGICEDGLEGVTEGGCDGGGFLTPSCGSRPGLPPTNAHTARLARCTPEGDSVSVDAVEASRCKVSKQRRWQQAVREPARYQRRRIAFNGKLQGVTRWLAL